MLAPSDGWSSLRLKIAMVSLCALGFFLLTRGTPIVLIVGVVAIAGVVGSTVRQLRRSLGTEQLASELAPELLRVLNAGPVPVEAVPTEPVACGACPRCATPLQPPSGGYDERRCQRGCGALLALTGSERLFDRAALDAEIVRAVVKEQGVKKGVCAGCGAAMHEALLRGVVVDLCLSCGALWLDDGELDKISQVRAFSAVSS